MREKWKWLWARIVWENIMKMIGVEFIPGYWVRYGLLDKGIYRHSTVSQKHKIIISLSEGQKRRKLIS